MNEIWVKNDLNKKIYLMNVNVFILNEIEKFLNNKKRE